MLSYLPLVLRNGIRNRRRSLLTVSSIAASFCMLGVLMAMYCLFFLSDPTPDQALRLIVRNRISFANPMPISYAERIKAVPGVREVMIQQWFGGKYKDARAGDASFARFAIEPEKLFALHPEYSISREEEEDFRRLQDSCILARPLAKRLGVRAGEHLALAGDIFPAKLNLRVAGFYDSAIDNEILYFHNRYLNESLRRGANFAIMFVVLVDGPEAVDQVASRIDALFRDSTRQTKTETERGFRLSFLRYVGNIKLFLFMVCASLAGTALLVSANSVAISVRERAAEVGILKALGFPPNTILWLIAGESMLMAAFGGLAGLALAEASIYAIRGLPAMMMNLPMLELSWGVASLSIVVAGLCGLAASLPAAWKASRRSIVDSLRVAD